MDLADAFIQSTFFTALKSYLKKKKNSYFPENETHELDNASAILYHRGS